MYVNKQSNHPPNVTKNIPGGINKRISDNSSNKEIFDEAAPKYQKEINEAGYDYTFKYEPPNPQKHNNSKKKNRKRDITWFNPPYSLNVSTRVGAMFLKIIDKCFPKGHPLHKILNRNTVKVSYRTTPNMKQLVSSHNTRLIKQNDQKQQQQEVKKMCNCQKNADPCPLEGNCLVKGVVYQATVTETLSKKSENYIGLTDTTFKDRHRNHKKSFKNAKYKTETELSVHLWKLQEQKIKYTIKWKIIDKGKSFNPVSKICQLSTKEKYYLIFKLKLYSLNENKEF